MEHPPTFIPTAELIRAAQCVFVAMTHCELVKEKVLDYKCAILVEGQWHPDAAWLTHGQDDKVVLDPAHAFLLSKEDFDVYHAKCESARLAAKLAVNRQGNCPLLEAEALLQDTRVLLLKSMEPITKIPSERLLGASPDLVEKAVEMALKLLAPHVETATTIASFGLPPHMDTGACTPGTHTGGH